MDLLSEISIKMACAELVARYCRAVNAWNLDEFTALFTEDGVWKRPGQPPMNGRAGIREFMESQPRNRVLRHVNGAVFVEVVDLDHARVWSQTTVYEASGTVEAPAPLEGPDMVVEYQDEHVRRDGAWRINRRDTAVVFKRGPPR
jgi:uncharacterized protein (TIGR02246 family)